MGWFGDKNAEAAARLRSTLGPLVPAGESLAGCVYATQQSTFSVSMYAIGVTEQHLIIQPIDRKWKLNGSPVLATRDEIDVGNLFSDGAFWSTGAKSQQMRFTVRGEKYEFWMMGGNWVENKLGGDEQAQGVTVLYDFLRPDD
jgi:hypothetical protein